MERKALGIAIGLLGCGLFGIATATPVQWKAADGGNDHFYEIVVNDSSNWSEMLNGIFFKDAAAEANAMGGHLATPSLSGEASFIYDSLVAPAEKDKEQRYWLGAYCSAPGQSYQWITGDTVTTWGGYTKIDGAGGEVPHGIVQGGGSGAALQDLPLSRPANGFIVEFDPPERAAEAEKTVTGSEAAPEGAAGEDDPAPDSTSGASATESGATPEEAPGN